MTIKLTEKLTSLCNIEWNEAEEEKEERLSIVCSDKHLMWNAEKTQEIDSLLMLEEGTGLNLIQFWFIKYVILTISVIKRNFIVWLFFGEWRAKGEQWYFLNGYKKWALYLFKIISLGYLSFIDILILNLIINDELKKHTSEDAVRRRLSKKKGHESAQRYQSA